MHLGLYCSQVMLRNAFIISPKNDIEKRLVLRERFTDIGLEPVFVDVDQNSYNICPIQIEKAISYKNEAILGVHTY